MDEKIKDLNDKRQATLDEVFTKARSMGAKESVDYILTETLNVIESSLKEDFDNDRISEKKFNAISVVLGTCRKIAAIVVDTTGNFSSASSDEAHRVIFVILIEVALSAILRPDLVKKLSFMCQHLDNMKVIGIDESDAGLLDSLFGEKSVSFE